MKAFISAFFLWMMICSSQIESGEKKVEYWAGVLLQIEAFEYGSSDLEYLALQENSERFNSIKKHLLQSFNTYVRKNYKHTDIYDYYHSRCSEIRESKIKQALLNKENAIPSYMKITDEVSAMVAADIRSKYGIKPGVLLCGIRIKRKDFPVLYEIKLSFTNDEDLGFKTGIGWADKISENLGYSTPEGIEGELKLAIDEIFKGWQKHNFIGFYFYGESSTPD
jgi:hypothetical protein